MVVNSPIPTWLVQGWALQQYGSARWMKTAFQHTFSPWHYSSTELNTA
jgi:hypothetical protein